MLPHRARYDPAWSSAYNLPMEICSGRVIRVNVVQNLVSHRIRVQETQHYEDQAVKYQL